MKRKYLQQKCVTFAAITLICLIPSIASSTERSLAVKNIENKRLALVIGNSNYSSAPLKNPVNDARDISAALKKLGFQVIYEEDASRRKMDDAIRNFYQKLRNGGVGLFYYSGHGMQVRGRNYLIPIGATIESESDIDHESIDIARVLGKMEDAGNPVNIVILDACRNNPFARSFRSAQEGLARMDAPTGTIVAYATAPESVADDGAGKNGMYTKHLLQAMTVPGLGIEQVFKAVRNNVINESNSKQIPWESTSLRGDFYFSSPRKEFSCSVECAPQDKPIDMVMASSQKNLIQYNKFKKNTGRSNPEFFTALKNIICDFRSIETSLKEHYNATRDESARNMQANTARTRQKYEDELCEKLPR